MTAAVSACCLWRHAGSHSRRAETVCRDMVIYLSRVQAHAQGMRLQQGALWLVSASWPG